MSARYCSECGHQVCDKCFDCGTSGLICSNCLNVTEWTYTPPKFYAPKKEAHE